jgi:DNA-binding NarL/FixJ family response regulator
MLLYTRLGATEEAVRQFQTCRETLMRELPTESRGRRPRSFIATCYRGLCRRETVDDPCRIPTATSNLPSLILRYVGCLPRCRQRGSGQKVVIADSDAVIRTAARLALEQDGAFSVAEAGSAEELKATVAAMRPTVALVDIGLPPASGLAAAAAVGFDHEVRVVLWDYSADPARILAGLQANVYGFLPKTIEPAAFVRALSGVAAGEACLSRELTSDLIEQLVKLARRERSRRLTDCHAKARSR